MHHQPQPVARLVWLNRVGDAGPRLHPSSTTAPPPSSSPSQHQAQLSRETPMEKPASRPSPHEQGFGAGTRSQEHHWDKNSSLHRPGIPSMGLAFPASLRPSHLLGVVAGKPKQTSFKPLPHDKAQALPEHIRLWGSTSNALEKKQNPGQKPRSHQVKYPTWC